MNQYNVVLRNWLPGIIFGVVLFTLPFVSSAAILDDISTTLSQITASLSKVVSSISSTQKAQVSGAGTTGSRSFTTIGPMSFIVPDNVTSLEVTMAGGGGGGSGGNNSVSWGSGGGGGGGYYRQVISVTPGQVIEGFVGDGGTGGCYANCNGNSGGNTTFGSLTATGGGGGKWGDAAGWAGGAGGFPGGQSGATQNVGSGGASGAGQGTGGGPGLPGGLYGGGGGAGREDGGVSAQNGAQGWINLKWSIIQPTITSVIPTSAAQGVNVPITIRGTNLSAATRLNFYIPGGTSPWGSLELISVSSDGTQVATVIDGKFSGNSLLPGTYEIALATADPGAVISNRLSFTITVAMPVPTITAITPISGQAGTSITLAGTGFLSSNTVNLIPTSNSLPIGQTNASSITGSSITFNLPSNLTIAGAYNVSVGNAGGSSNTIPFTVTSQTTPTVQTPQITSLSQTSGSVGSTVYIYGSNFSQGAYIAADCCKPIIIPANFISNGLVSFVVPTSLGIGVHSVSVQNSEIQSPSNAVSFTVTVATPTVQTPQITSLSQTSGSVGSTVYIYGSNFSQGAYIAADCCKPIIIPANFISNGLVSFVVPTSLGIGVHSVSVQNSEIQQGSNTISFNVIAPQTPTLSITVLSPNGGEQLVAGGTYRISWMPNRDDVNLVLLDANKNRVATIEGNRGSSSPYSWTIPTSTASGKYYIRAEGESLGFSDDSDAVFTIITSTVVPSSPATPPSSNLTTDALQAQINSLLLQLQNLQNQLANLTATPPSISLNSALKQTLPADIDPAQASSCAQIINNMKLGSRDSWTNGEVTKLQGALILGGYLNVEATGYFGYLTLKAVQAFQTANGLDATGFVGPLTREKIKIMTCN